MARHSTYSYRTEGSAALKPEAAPVDQSAHIIDFGDVRRDVDLFDEVDMGGVRPLTLAERIAANPFLGSLSSAFVSDRKASRTSSLAFGGAAVATALLFVVLAVLGA